MKKSTKLILIEGGLHNVYKETYRLLNDLFNVTIITSDTERIENIKTISLESKSFFIPSFRYYKKLYTTLKKENPNIVSVRAYYRPYAIATLAYVILHKKRFIIMEEQRNDPPSICRKILFWKLLCILRPVINAKAERIICITRSSATYLAQKGFKKVVYIPVPFVLPTTHAKINIKNNRVLKIICVARFERYKGHEILLSALAHEKNFTLTLIGEGPLRKEIEKQAASLGLLDVIHFMGHLPHNKLAAQYQSHDLFVLPSLSEPVGAVVFEAMAYGLPVIVSSGVGAKDAVDEGKNGFIFESKNSKDLAEKIHALQNLNLRKKFGEESARIIRDTYDPQKIKELYKKIIHA